MQGFKLTSQELTALRQLHREMKKKKDAYRLNAVILLGTGWTLEAVSEALLLDTETLRRYVDKYRQAGIKGLLRVLYQGRVCLLGEDDCAELTAYLSEHLYSTTAGIIAYVKKTYRVVYSESGMQSLLHRLGFSYKKPKLVPGKADSLQQQTFIQAYRQLRQTQADAPVYFMDGTHPLHNARPAYGWFLKGQEKVLKTNTGRQRLNLNGAINITTLKTIVQSVDTLNAQSAIALFKAIQAQHPNIRTVYVICDNAPYYRCRLVKEYLVGSNIQLIFLPPYSPNLNLIERLWGFYYRKVIDNHYYETFAEFASATGKFFQYLRKYKPELKTLLAENFQMVETRPYTSF